MRALLATFQIIVNLPGQKEVSELSKRYFIEKRRDEILENHEEALKESENGELEFSNNVDNILSQLQ